MQTIIKEKIKINHNSTARNNLPILHLIPVQKGMYISDYMDIICGCLLWYRHSKNLKNTPYLRDWLNKSCAIHVRDHHVRKCKIFPWIGTLSQSTAGPTLIVMVLGIACHGLLVFSLNLALHSRLKTWFSQSQIPSLWGWRGTFITKYRISLSWNKKMKTPVGISTEFLLIYLLELIK